MEIGDIFIVNKADRDGADRVALEINFMLDFNHQDRKPPVIMTVATLGTGIDELGQSIMDHMEYLKATNKFLDRRKNNSKIEILEIIKQNIIDMVSSKSQDAAIDELSIEVSQRKIDPYTAAEQILQKLGERGESYDK